MLLRLIHLLRVLSVRARLATADVYGVAGEALARRLADERGAQVAEYAMLGGVSAAFCGALIAILRNPDLIERLVEAVLNVLIDVVTGWF